MKQQRKMNCNLEYLGKCSKDLLECLELEHSPYPYGSNTTSPGDIIGFCLVIIGFVGFTVTVVLDLIDLWRKTKRRCEQRERCASRKHWDQQLAREKSLRCAMDKEMKALSEKYAELGGWPMQEVRGTNETMSDVRIDGVISFYDRWMGLFTERRDTTTKLTTYLLTPTTT